MKRAWFFLAIIFVLPLPLVAQTGQTVEELERRLRTLEEQVRALEAQIAALRASAGAPAPPAAPAAPEPPPPLPPGLAAPPTGGDRPAPAQLPVYGTASSKLLNPDIGIIGNFIAALGDSQGGSEAVAPFPFLTLQESETSLQAIMDPYARADFFLAIGEDGIEVEEGYATFPTLPGGLVVRAGKMRANFGRLNAFHNHTLPWIDRPLVMFNLLGGATEDPDTGIKDAGLSVNRLLPAGNLFVEATAEVFRGDSGTLFQASRRQDFSVVGRLRGYADLTNQTNLEVGASYARGHNDQGSDFLTELYGLDLTLRWKPLRLARYRSLVARSELIWSRRQEPLTIQRALGSFASLDYQLGRRWFTGARWDWSERARDAGIRDRGISAVLTYWPSEFSQVRGQYRWTRYGDGPAAQELLFQFLFTIGTHGAHPF
jgi:hypothetical protein